MEVNSGETSVLEFGAALELGNTQVGEDGVKVSVAVVVELTVTVLVVELAVTVLAAAGAEELLTTTVTTVEQLLDSVAL